MGVKKEGEPDIVMGVGPVEGDVGSREDDLTAG